MELPPDIHRSAKNNMSILLEPMSKPTALRCRNRPGTKKATFRDDDRRFREKVNVGLGGRQRGPKAPGNRSRRLFRVQYGFDLDADINGDDVVFEHGGVKLVIDETSLELMSGSVDYKEDLIGSYFAVSNPIATSTCGCGTCFRFKTAARQAPRWTMDERKRRATGKTVESGTRSGRSRHIKSSTAIPGTPSAWDDPNNDDHCRNLERQLLKARLDHLLKWLESASPDVVVLRKSKCSKTFPFMETRGLGYRCAVKGQKAYNGVAILSKSPIEVTAERLPAMKPTNRPAIWRQTAGIRVGAIYLPNGNPVADGKTEKFIWQTTLDEAPESSGGTLLKTEETVVSRRLQCRAR